LRPAQRIVGARRFAAEVRVSESFGMLDVGADSGAVSPNQRYPFALLPQSSDASAESERHSLPPCRNPCSSTVTRIVAPLYARVSVVPGAGSRVSRARARAAHAAVAVVGVLAALRALPAFFDFVGFFVMATPSLSVRGQSL